MLQTHFRTAQTVYLTSALLVILRIGHILETVLSYGLWGVKEWDGENYLLVKSVWCMGDALEAGQQNWRSGGG